MAEPIACPLDPLLKTHENWQSRPDSFEAAFTHKDIKRYVSFAKDRTRAKISSRLYRKTEIHLSAFDAKVPAQEATVDFADGHLNLISISMDHRADSADVLSDEWSVFFQDIGKAMVEVLKAPYRLRC